MAKPFMGIPREKIPWAPTIDPQKCIGCGTCLETCPNGVFMLDEETNTVKVVEPLNCVVLCDKCTGFCSEEAISFPDKTEIKRLLGQLLQAMGQELKKP